MELTELELAARRMGTEQTAAERLTAARTKLVLGKDAKSVFFATVALRLESKPDWTIDTAATDGRSLVYNPEFLAGLSPAQAVGLVAHEVMHITSAHHARMGHRDPSRWNVACDLAINPLLIEADLSLPEGALLPGKGSYANLPDGMSAEGYYAELAGQGEEPGNGTDPGRCGGVLKPGDGSEAAMRQAEAEAQVMASQAQQIAQQRGELPGGMGRVVSEVLAPKVDWRDVLREFVNRSARNDYSWSSPNRRYIAQGLYLPGLRSEELGDVALAVDVSGSIDQQLLSRFAGEVQGILEAYECSLTVLYHDSQVQKVEQWQSSDGPLVLCAEGGGGTDHRPVFDWITLQGVAPTCLVCLTDLYSTFPKEAPDYPVLWAVQGEKKRPGLFGQRVSID